MTSTDLIPTAVLARKAVVYVRQSTQSQVMINLKASDGNMISLTWRDSASATSK